MANSGIVHAVAVVPVTRTEYESEAHHALSHGTAFPSSPTERQLFYRDDLHVWYVYNGSSWTALSPGAVTAHKTTHQDGGSDEISIAGLAGESTELAAHKANPSAHHSNVLSLTFIIDGGGSAITTGQKGHLEVPFACTITGWTILADQSGSIVVDVWKDTYANFPPTVADTIAGTEKPTLASVQKNQDLTLTTWTTAIAAGNILAFNVDSAATVTRVTLSIRATKT